jgi:hypothetical protein
MNLAGLTEVSNTPEGKVDSPINKFVEEEAPFDVSAREQTPITKFESNVGIQEPIEVPDTDVPDVESMEVPDTTDVPDVESMEVPDTEVPDIDPSVLLRDGEVPDIESVEVPDTEVPDIEFVEAPDTEVSDIQAVEIPDTEVPDIQPVEVPDTEVPDVESVEVPDTEVPDIQSVEAPDIPDLKSVEAPDVFSDQDSMNVEAPNMEIGYPPMQQQNELESPSETSYEDYEQSNPSLKEYDSFSAATSEYNSSYEEPPRKARDFADTMAETVFGAQREMRDLPNTGGFGQEMAPMFNINVSLGGGEDEFVRQLTEQLTPKINEQQYIIQELTKQHFEMNNSLLFLMGDD